MKAILFDLDDTLIPERPTIEAGYAAVAEHVWGVSTPTRISTRGGESATTDVVADLTQLQDLLRV